MAEETADSVFHLWGHGWEIEKNNDWFQLEALLKALNQ